MEARSVTRSPNQETRRREIVVAAAKLVSIEGLGACTIRRIADTTALTKSTIHYYFADAEELTDLVVVEVVSHFAKACRRAVAGLNRDDAVATLTRVFLGREPSVTIGESLLWYEYSIQSIFQNRTAGLALTYDLVTEVVIDAVGDEAQARALHVYLMGLTIRNRTAPLADAEIARAVSALTSTEVGAAYLA